MSKYALNIDSENRILRITYEKYASADSILVDNRPEDLVPEDATAQEKNARNYLYIDGKYVYEPLPDPPKPEPPVEPVTADEMAIAIMEGVNAA